MKALSLSLPLGLATLLCVLQPALDARAVVNVPPLSRALPPGPDAQVRITEQYARLVARDAWFWAWPVVNIYNRRLAFQRSPEPVSSAVCCRLRRLTGWRC